MHNGTEYQPKPSEAQITFAHAAIDAGAKLVIGHHPHVVQPSEDYHNGLIYYSLGNFVFDQYQREATQHGELVEISFLGREIVNTHEMNVKITPSGPELEYALAAGSEFHVAAKFEAHGRQYLFSESVFAARAETGEQRGGQHFYRHCFFDRGVDGPSAFT